MALFDNPSSQSKDILLSKISLIKVSPFLVSKNIQSLIPIKPHLSIIPKQENIQDTSEKHFARIIRPVKP